MKQYLNILLSLFLTVTSLQPAFAQTKVDGSLLKGDVIGGTASNTRRLVVPKDTKTNLDAKTRLEANLVYGTDTKKAYIDNGTSLVAVGSGSGGAVNLITDGDAENSTSSIFVPYNDGAVAFPIDGTGGSPTVTTSVTSTDALTGAKSYLLTKPASVVQGQGWSIPFTVDPSYRAKVLKISVDYIVNSGTFTAGASLVYSDIIWYVYDVTNSKLIEPSSTKMLSNSSTLSDKFEATFQTSATGSSYRLIAHMATGFSTAFEIKIDNVTVSPSAYVYGTPISDWQAYTPTYAGFGTVTSSVAYWRRLGDSIEITATGIAGTPTGSTASISLPNGLSVDSTKTSTAVKEVGMWTRADGSVNARKRGLMIAISSSGNLINFANDDYVTAVSPITSLAGNAIVGTSQAFTISIRDVAIQGFSSSVQMSDSADTRLMLARYKTAAAQSIPSATFTIVDFGTKDFDTHGAVTTGAAWKFTAISSGYFRIGTHIRVSTALNGVNFAARIYKNGVAGPALADNTTDNSASGRGDITGSTIVELVAGDYVDIRVIQNSGGAVTLLSDADYVYIDIEKLSGPSAIAASEKISASYYMAADASVSTTLPFQYNTKLWDTHGAVTTGSSWKFTAPIAGRYKFRTLTLSSGAGGGWIGIYKNGTLYQRLGYHADLQNNPENASATIELLAGEYFDIRSISAFTALGGALSSGVCQITIEKE